MRGSLEHGVSLGVAVGLVEGLSEPGVLDEARWL